MNLKPLAFLGLSVLFGAQHFFAQIKADSSRIQILGEIYLTDTKYEVKQKNSGKVIAVLDSTQLKSYYGLPLTDLLNTVAGVEINGGRGQNGQNLNYYFRGGRNRQVVVLIDGGQVNDPSQIANDFDLRLLATEQIQKIEIMKGASSVLYGSGAATAVINITTKKASNQSFSLEYTTVLGTNSSQNEDQLNLQQFRNSAILSGKLKRFTYKANLVNRYSDGISTIAAGKESDYFSALNLNFQLGYRVDSTLSLSTYYSRENFKSEFDNSFTLTDAENLSISETNRLGLTVVKDYNKGSIHLNANRNLTHREIESIFPTIFEGRTNALDFYNKYKIGNQWSTVVGLNIIHSSMRSESIAFEDDSFMEDIRFQDARFTISDPYANLLFTTDFGLQVNVGSRLNVHSEYGNHLVYSVNPSYNFNLNNLQLKALATYSTAYITPSLYQLFEPNYGNLDLQPEENATLEFGLNAILGNDLNISAVYFRRSEENFVDFVDLGEFVFQYQNVEKDFVASGLEVQFEGFLVNKLLFSSNFTYTNVEKSLNLRIPTYKVNSSLSFNPNGTWGLMMRYQYNDSRTDSFYNSETFASEQVNLRRYQLVDLHFNHYLLKEKLNVFINLTNVLDEDFEEIYRYSTKGRNFSVGLTFHL